MELFEENKVPQETAGQEDLGGQTGLTMSQEEVTFPTRIKGKKSTSKVKMGIHGLSQFTHSPKREKELIDQLSDQHNLSPEERVRSIARELMGLTGVIDPDRMLEQSGLVGNSLVPKVSEENLPSQVGLDLTPCQYRIMSFLLQRMSETNYQGVFQQQKTKELMKTYSGNDHKMRNLDNGVDFHGKHLGGPYQNITSLPVIRFTQAELITGAGGDLQEGRSRDFILSNFVGLILKPYLFMWDRLVRDTRTGKPVVDKRTGKYKLETVTEVSPVIRCQIVKDKETQKVKYYETSFSAVFLDQVTPDYGGNHFVLMPSSWTEEVKEKTRKRGNPLDFQVLLWLRAQFELIRRDNQHKEPKKDKKSKGATSTQSKRPYRFTRSYEDLCQTFGFSEYTYRKNRKRTTNLLQRSFTIAYELGYLSEPVSLTILGEYEFVLNESFYPKPNEDMVMVEEVENFYSSKTPPVEQEL